MSQAEFAAQTRDDLIHELEAFHREGGRDADQPRRIREALARLALDEMYQFVGICEPGGTLLEANRPALRAGGVSRADVVGRPLWEAHWWSVDPHTQEDVRGAIRRAAAGEFVRYEVDIWAGGGGHALVTVDFSLRPVLDGAGKVVFLVAEGRDITEKKAAEAALSRAHAELQDLYQRVKELDDLKSRFFANVSHELRTPLALVLGPVERFLARPGLSPEDREDLEVVARNARTLLKHVNDLLEASRIEAGRARVDFAEVDLGRLVRIACAHFDAVSRERQIDFLVAAPPADAELDPDKIERVVLNLVSNAFKFTPAEGRIRVTLAIAGGRARLEVADSGPGVPPPLREKAFERFRQLDGGPARRFGGIGLGLAIAKDFVELHGGRIGLDAAPEGGALAWVDLPLRAPPGETVRPATTLDHPDDATARAMAESLLRRPGPPAPSGAGAGDRPLVLVVEDNPEMNDFLRAALAPDYRTAGAHDGADGLRLADALRPDLVLTDVMMPGTDGEALLVGLRSHPDLAFVPVVLLTAKADDTLRARLLAEGAQDYVAKPVAIPELRARVGNLVAMKRARDVLQAEIAEQAEDVGRLAQEVTRRKRELQTALDAMRFAREQAERASAQKTSLMHLVSHELRTPLSALLLQVERLRREEDAFEPRHRQVIGRMRGSTLRLAELVASLLEFNQIQSGRLSVRPDEVDVAAIARDVADELRPQADSKALALEVTAPADLPPLRSDPRLFRLVLVNLVGNGIKFTDRGGVTVSAAVEGGLHRVTVADTGRGIAAEDRGRVFEPFEQLEALAKKHTTGIGLGLTLVRELVQALGGTISVESEVGVGSRFTVSLPTLADDPTAR
jgi:PAS domain S-box-containing protein